jgi:hypothetical protein
VFLVILLMCFEYIFLFHVFMSCCVIMQIKFCTENNKRLIHFSTCEVFGKTIGSFLPEEYRKVFVGLLVFKVNHLVAF